MTTNVIPLDVARFDRDEPISLKDLPRVETYTVLEVAARLGIGRCMAYELVRQGVIPAKRLGRRWIVLRAGLALCPDLALRVRLGLPRSDPD